MRGVFGRGRCGRRVQGAAGGVRIRKSTADCSSSVGMGGSAWAGGACPYEGGSFSCKKGSIMAGWLLCGSGEPAGFGREGGCLRGGDIPLPNFLASLYCAAVAAGSVNCCGALGPFAPLMMSPVPAASGKFPVWTSGEAAVPPTALGWPGAPLGTAFPVVVVRVRGCFPIPVLHLPAFPVLLSQK